MATNPRLSICIPTYNFGNYIGQTLDSIFNQPADNLEVIIGDGGSSDNTSSVIAKYIKVHPNIKYHNFGSKGGIDVDIAKTIDLASGDFIWLLSADDVLTDNSIMKLLSYLSSDISIYLLDRIDCDKSLFPLNSRHWLKDNDHNIYNFSISSDLRCYLNKSLGLGALFSYMSSIVVKRESWVSSVAPEIFYGSNYAHVATLFNISLNGGRLMWINSPFVYNRNFNDSFMSEGITTRFIIDFYGYDLIMSHFFTDLVTINHIKRIMRFEHKWFHLFSLRSKVNNSDWSKLKKWLYHYRYLSVVIFCADFFGRSTIYKFLSRVLKPLTLHFFR